MKIWLFFCFATLTSGCLVAQADGKHFLPAAFIESRQGHHPDGPDTIGHAVVSRDATLKCDMVEVYDEAHKESTACVIRFGKGLKYTLTFGQSMQSPEETEVYCNASAISRVAAGLL